MTERWVKIEWPDEMPRSVWEVGPDLGLIVRDYGNGPMVSLKEALGVGGFVPLRYRAVAGSIGNAPLDLADLATWDQPPQTPAFVQYGRAEVQRRLEDGSLASRISALQLAFSMAPAGDLVDLVNGYLVDRLPELVGGSVLIVEAPRLKHGSLLSLCRGMIRAEQFPGVIQRSIADPSLFEGGMGLESGDVLGGASYLLPAVSATSPSHLGAVAHRGSGSLILAFGNPIRSPEDRRPVSLADVHQPHYFTEPRTGLTVLGRVQAGDSGTFIAWWIDRWNGLLSELFDPASHRRHDGTFDPYLMIGRYFTIQRLLACAQSILVNAGLEEFTRMELLFESLDLMDGLGWHVGDWKAMTTPTTVTNALARLKAELAGHDSVERVVMERCERGVEALLALRDGFRDGVNRNEDAIDRAVFEFLRGLRNAGHGLNGSQDSNKALVNLMRHKASVSPDLPELVWFHLVRALCLGTWDRQRHIDRERGAAALLSEADE